MAFICGFILPRYILSYFGSDANGLVASITQFLSIVSFLELGVGPVIQSNLYKPLADNDMETTSKIVASAEKFYRKIAYFFLLYIFVLFFAFPHLNGEFKPWYTSSLLLIISVSTFSQYYFGITYQVFLNADQKVYVQTSLQIITIILNTLLSIILMKLGCGIHVVKLASAVVYVIRPVAQNIYVKKHYKLNLKIKYTEEPIKQKWNGFAQHLAAVVCGQIDIVLLTLFSTYRNVSIYSVYFLVVNGVEETIMTAVSGLESFWGNMFAKKEYESLNKTFQTVETLMHAGATWLFTVTAILIAPFISVYTSGLEDSSAYILPVFGACLTFAYGIQCLRVPYFRIIKAAGHYKETQNGAFISMMLNIVLSVALVFKFSLIGVATGTIAAMLYHTVYFAWYLRKNIINRPFHYFVRHIVVDVITAVISYAATNRIKMLQISYTAWILYAFIVTAIVAVITLLLNLPIYKSDFEYLIKKIIKKI
ncbi:MAG: hypothetical protein ACTTJW_02120 [Sphaerochaeta sp.]